MLKYVSFGTSAILLALAAGCGSDPSEEPNDAVLEQDTEACSTPVEPSEQPADVTPEATPHLQSSDATQDAALIAESQGITVEQAEAQFYASVDLDRVTSRLAVERPDIFVGSALSTEADGPSRIYIKGPADEFVCLLAANADLEIEVIDNQPYSRSELDARQQRLVSALEAMGFRNIGAGYDITKRGHIEVAVTQEAGLPQTSDEILASIPAEFHQGVTLTVTDTPVAGHD